MSIRKRKWTTASGEDREAWIVDYRDADGERHVKTFGRKKDADAYHSKVKVDVEAGVHVAPAKSITVAEAAESWLKACDANGLERSTLKTYREEVRLQIVPMIGSMKLSDVSAAVARKFEDRLRESGRSPQMVRRVVRSLGSLLADAQEQGLAAHNAVRDLRRNRKRGKERQAERRQKGKLKAGVHIPLPVEIKAVLESSGSRWRPLLVTAVVHWPESFRASWPNVGGRRPEG
jgi:integrase